MKEDRLAAALLITEIIFTACHWRAVISGFWRVNIYSGPADIAEEMQRKENVPANKSMTYCVLVPVTLRVYLCRQPD